MIKKEYKLVAIPGSKRELVPHHLIQRRDTHQFGTIQPSSLRGRQARRNLRDNFDPISLYIVEINSDLHDHQRGIITLKDGSKIVGIPHDHSEDSMMLKEKIFLLQRDIFNCWVEPPYLGEQHQKLPYFEFKFISSRNLQLVFERGGRIWIEMEIDLVLDESPVLAGFLGAQKVKLHEGKPIIHLME